MVYKLSHRQKEEAKVHTKTFIIYCKCTYGMCILDLTPMRFNTGHSENNTNCLVAKIHQ